MSSQDNPKKNPVVVQTPPPNKQISQASLNALLNSSDGARNPFSKVRSSRTLDHANSSDGVRNPTTYRSSRYESNVSYVQRVGALRIKERQINSPHDTTAWRTFTGSQTVGLSRQRYVRKTQSSFRGMSLVPHHPPGGNHPTPDSSFSYGNSSYDKPSRYVKQVNNPLTSKEHLRICEQRFINADFKHRSHMYKFVYQKTNKLSVLDPIMHMHLKALSHSDDFLFKKFATSLPSRSPKKKKSVVHELIEEDEELWYSPEEVVLQAKAAPTPIFQRRIKALYYFKYKNNQKQFRQAIFSRNVVHLDFMDRGDKRIVAAFLLLSHEVNAFKTSESLSYVPQGFNIFAPFNLLIDVISAPPLPGEPNAVVTLGNLAQPTVLHALYIGFIELIGPYVHRGSILRELVPFGMFLNIMQLVTATTIPQMILAIEAIQTYTSMNPFFSREFKEVTNLAFVFFKSRLVRGWFEEKDIVNQGLEDIAGFMKLKNSPLVVKVMGLLAISISTFLAIEDQAFGTNLLARMMEVVSAMKNPATILEAIIELGHYFSKQYAVYNETGNFFDLFGVSAEIAWIRKAEALEAERQQIRTNGGDTRALIIKMKGLYEQSTKFKDSTVAAMARSLRESITGLESTMSKSIVPPLGIIMSGPSGTGKTAMVDILAQSLKLKLGQTGEDTGIWDKVNTKHPQIPPVVNIIHCNDAFAQKDEYCGESTLVDYQRMVDSIPYSGEGASLAEKSNRFVYNSITFASTNQADYVCTQSTQGANKLDRRYILGISSWSESFILKATSLNCAPHELYKEHFRDYPHAVDYKFGRMKNKNGNVITFKIETMLYECNTQAEAIGFILSMEAQRTFIDFNNELQRCKCGAPLESTFCGCPERLFDVDKARRGIKQSLPERVSERTPVELPDLPVMPPRGLLGGLYMYARGISVPSYMEADFEIPPDTSTVEQLPEDEIVNQCCRRKRASSEEDVFFDTFPVHSDEGDLEEKSDDAPPMESFLGKEEVAYGTRPEGWTKYESINRPESKGWTRFGDKVYGKKWGETEIPTKKFVYPPAMTRYEKFKKFMSNFKPTLKHDVPGLESESKHWRTFFELEISNLKKCVSVSSKKLKIFAAIATSILALTTVLPMLMKLRDVLNPQGMVHSTPSFPEPPPEEKVEIYLDTKNQWLGAIGDTKQVKIQSKHLKMFAAVVLHNLIAVPKHFWEKLVKGDTFTLSLPGNEVLVTYDPFLREDADNDLSFYFVCNLPSIANVCYPNLPQALGTPLEKCNLGPFKDFPVARDLTYPASVNTQFGDCGLLLIGKETQTIYGFHVGFFTTSGRRISVGLSKSIVNRAISKLEARKVLITKYSNELPDVVQEQMKQGKISPGLHPRSDGSWVQQDMGPRFAETDHIPIGHFQSTDKENFTCRPSTMFPYFGNKAPECTTPWPGKAKLQPDGTWQSAVTMRFKSMLRQNVTLDFQLMLKAVDAYVDRFPECSLTPYSDQTAMCGNFANVLVNGADTTKSVGPSLKHYGVSKNSCYEKISEEGEYIIHPILLREIEKAEKRLLEDELIAPCLVAATAKDERYTVEKHNTGKKRYFYVSDKADNHISRKYILPLLAKLHSIPEISHMITTMNAGSPAWKGLYNTVTKFGPEVIDGDQQGFDQHHRLMMQFFIIFMVTFAEKMGYNPDEVKMVRRILEKARRYVIVMEGNLYICYTGLNSGRPDTIVVNSVILVLLFVYIFYKLKPANDKRNPYDLLTIAVCGDDSITGMCSTIRSWYTGPSIAREMLNLGYDMTPGDKIGEVGLRNIHDIEFLKRKFVVSKDALGITRVMAPLSLKSMYGSLAYSVGVRSEEDRIDRDRATTLSVAREFFMHGREMYEEHVSIFKEIFPDQEYPEYEELLNDYDHGIFQTWSTTDLKKITYGINQPPQTELTLQGVGSGVNIPDISWAVCRGSTTRRGAILDFPVQTISTLNRGIKCGLTNSSTEINPTAPFAEQTTMADTVATIEVVAGDEVSAGRSADFKPKIISEMELSKFFARPRRIALSSLGIIPPTPLLSTWKAIPQVKGLLQGYGLFRGDAVITLVYTGSSSLMGKGRLYVYPSVDKVHSNYTDDNELYRNNNDNTITSTMPHIDVDFSSMCSCTLRLPYPLAHDYTVDTDWTMQYYVVNPTVSAQGNTPIDVLIDVYVHYENVKLSRIIPQGGTPEINSRALSAGLALASHISSFMPSFVSPYTAILKAGARAAYTMGYSRAVEPILSSAIMRKWGDISYMAGQAMHAYVLGSDPTQNRDVSGSSIPGYKEADMCVSDVARRWSMVVADWQGVEEQSITPGLCLQVGNTWYPTNLAAMSLMYERWRGDIDIKIEIMGSPLIRWRLGFVILPPGVVAPASFPTDGNYLTYMLEIAGSTEYEFTVPYLHVEPYRYNQLRPIGTGAFLDETRLMVFGLTTAMGPAATPVEPYINIWIRAGEDFSFAVPSMQQLNEAYVEQGGPSVEQTCQYFGEYVDDMKLLATRKCRGGEFFTTNTDLIHGTFQMYADYFPPNSAIPPAFLGGTIANPQFTFDTYIRLFFLGYTGGTAYSLACSWSTEQTFYTGVGQIGIDYASQPLTSSRGAVIADLEEQPIVELIVPDRSGYGFKFPKALGTGSVVELLVSENEFNSESIAMPVNIGWRIWQGAGDDRVYGMYLGTFEVVIP